MTKRVLLAAIGIVAPLTINSAHAQYYRPYQPYTSPNTYTTVPLGNGWSTTTDNHGNSCTTIPLGNGFSNTNCQ
jgi:hypothetical protein